MSTKSVLFKYKFVTGIHSLLDERCSDSSAEEYSMLVKRLQLSVLFTNNVQKFD